MKQKLELVVLNGSPLLGRAIQRIIEQHCPDMVFVKQVFFGSEELKAMYDHMPDIVLLDTEGQGEPILDTVREISEMHPDVQLVVLTAGDNPAIIKQLIFLGLHHYCRKPLDTKDFQGMMNRLTTTMLVTATMGDLGQINEDVTKKHQQLFEAIHTGCQELVDSELTALHDATVNCEDYDSTQLRSLYMEIAMGIATLNAPEQMGEILLAFYKSFVGNIMTADTREVLWKFLSKLVNDATALFSQAPSNKRNQIISRTIQIIEERHSEQITLESIATELFFSQSYLSRLFKQCTGKSFRDYLCDCRLEHAKVLLQTTEHTVDAIALEVGYENANSFRRLFKSKNGVSAGEYRKQLVKHSKTLNSTDVSDGV